MEKIVGIDLDNTACFCNSAVYKFLAKRYVLKNKNIKSVDITEEQRKKYTKKLLTNKIFKFFNPSKYLAYPHAVETINDLHNRGYKIYFISSRPTIKPVVSMTVQWLTSNEIYFDKLILGCNNKPVCAKEIGVEFFIDDIEKYHEKFIESGIKPLIFKSSSNNTKQGEVSSFEQEKRLSEIAVEANSKSESKQNNREDDTFSSWEEIKEYFDNMEKC